MEYRKVWRAAAIIVTVAAISFLTSCTHEASDGSSGKNGTDSKSPLHGKVHHDFGLRRIQSNRPLELNHAFELTNASSEVVDILKVTSTCGCAVAELSDRSISPGETVVVDTTLTLKSPGTIEQHIVLVLDSGLHHILSVQATAQEESGIHARQGAVALQLHNEAIVGLYSVSDGAVPQAPQLTVPPGVEAVFGKWIPAVLPNDPEARYARWIGSVRVTRSSSWKPSPGDTLVVHSGDQIVRVSLVGQPHPVIPPSD